MRQRFPFILLSVVVWSLFASASSTPPLVTFNEGLIPKLDKPLPILSLGPHATISPDLLEQFVSTVAPNATLTTDPKTRGQYAYDGDRLVAIYDAGSGETRVFPNFGQLPPAQGPISIEPAFGYIRNNQTFPTDHTIVSIANGSNLVGSTFNRDENSSGPHLYLSHAVVQRNITSGGHSYSVCGPGSTASFGFAADGNAYSLSYFWKPATLTNRTVNSNTTEAIFNSIVKQLVPTASAGVPVRVDGVDVCFYDSGANFIQPVYRFWATLHANSSGNRTTSPTHLLGYLPIGSHSPEAIPDLSNPPQRSVQPTTPVAPKGLVGVLQERVPTIRVGRYVVRNDSHQWVTNANNFLSVLQSPNGILGNILGSIFSSLGPRANFLNSQYYWAYPYLFTTSKNSFINSVHLAETEVHGNWHLFSTLQNDADFVHLSDIPADGYGGGANGTLAYWILHSCEVIPTTTDYSAADRHLAFDAWFRVFNGLHAVVGYRTEMWIADSVIPTFGRSISLGAPFVSSWLQIVHDDTADYVTKGKDQLYFDTNRQINEPMGRPSAVVVCGHEGDTVLQIENLGRPSCLREFWYEN